MQIELDAKELAYVTYVTGRAPAHEVGFRVHERLWLECKQNAAAIIAFHDLEKELGQMHSVS